MILESTKDKITETETAEYYANVKWKLTEFSRIVSCCHCYAKEKKVSLVCSSKRGKVEDLWEHFWQKLIVATVAHTTQYKIFNEKYKYVA